MNINATNPAYATANFVDNTTVKTQGKQQLGADDFLKLLTTQLTSQDPMKPMEDTQFIAQMAQFSSLEQMRTLSTNFSDFASGQKLNTAQQYLGKTVTLTDDAAGMVSGQVSEIAIVDGEPRLMIGGKDFDPADVTSVRESLLPTTSTPTPTAP